MPILALIHIASVRSNNFSHLNSLEGGVRKNLKKRVPIIYLIELIFKEIFQKIIKPMIRLCHHRDGLQSNVPLNSFNLVIPKIRSSSILTFSLSAIFAHHDSSACFYLNIITCRTSEFKRWTWFTSNWTYSPSRIGLENF